MDDNKKQLKDQADVAASIKKHMETEPVSCLIYTRRKDGNYDFSVIGMQVQESCYVAKAAELIAEKMAKNGMNL